MKFPITDLLSPEASEQWLLDYFHPDGLKCPKCQSPVERAGLFRVTRKSELKVYRCKDCKSLYNLYTGTVFAQRQFLFDLHSHIGACSKPGGISHISCDTVNIFDDLPHHHDPSKRLSTFSR